MPARKKPKTVEVWVIKCDGLRVDTAPTEAEARVKAKALEKSLPTYVNFSFALEQQKPAHCTTA